MNNIKYMLIALGVTILIFLLVGTYEYIQMRQINKKQETAIEQLKAKNSEIAKLLMNAENNLQFAKEDLERVEKEKKQIEQSRNKDLESYKAKLKDLANSSDIERDMILKKHKTFKYEN